MAIDPEAFYAGMSKPVPPRGDVLGGAQEAQERPSVSPPRSSAPTASRDGDASEAAARRFYGHQELQDRAGDAAGGNASQAPEPTEEAPDGPEELSEGQRRQEEFRQIEEARAERMFGDRPDDPDHFVNFEEPELSHASEFSFEPPPDLAANLSEGEGSQIVSAFIESGIGRTLAGSLVEQGIAAARRGPMSPEQVAERNASAMADLTAKWGDRTDEKLAEAREMVRKAAVRWPGLPAFLERSGLGSDAKLIQQLVARAELRPGRKR